MSTTTAVPRPGTAATPSVTDRRRPAFGGFSRTVLAIELRRLARNRRSVVFTLVMPVVFFFMFGRTQTDPEAQRYVLVSLAVYAAMVGTTSTGASVAVERSQGWTRQLRLTPLHPLAYMAVKASAALLVGLLAVVVQLTVGTVSGVRFEPSTLVLCALAAWLGSVVFAAFGLFMGYLLPSENVMQLLGPALSIMAFFGGLFVPVAFLGQTMQQIATVTPMYGIGELARAPLGDGGVSYVALANVLAWTAVFVAGAVWRFRRDTARG